MTTRAERSLEELKTARRGLVPRATPVRNPDPFPEDDYDFGKELGRGAYGVVYIATYLPTGQQVVVKKMDKAKVSLLDALVEANGLQRLHEICTKGTVPCFYDVYQDDDNYYIVEELLGGPWVTLENFISGNLGGRVPRCADEMLIAQNLIDSVRILHKHNVVSRDYKPENVMVNLDDCRIKILDLGLACLTELSPVQESRGPAMRTRAALQTARQRAEAEEEEQEEEEQKERRTVTIASEAQRRETVREGVCGRTCIGWGTPGYIAPEALQDSTKCYYGLEAGKRVDLWALGMTLIELFLKRPFLRLLARRAVEEQKNALSAEEEQELESALEEGESESGAEPFERPARIRRPPMRYRIPANDGWHLYVDDIGLRTQRGLRRQERKDWEAAGERTRRGVRRQQVKNLEEERNRQVEEEEEAERREQDQDEETEYDLEQERSEQESHAIDEEEERILLSDDPLPLDDFITNQKLLRVLKALLDKDPEERKLLDIL